MEASDWAASLANLPEEQRGPLFGLPVPLDDDDVDDGDSDEVGGNGDESMKKEELQTSIKHWLCNLPWHLII